MRLRTLGSGTWARPLSLALIAGMIATAVFVSVMIFRHVTALPSAPGNKAAGMAPLVTSETRPDVEPLVLKAIDPKTAVEINAAVPFSTAPNPAAKPFMVAGAADSIDRAIDCLATAVYYEAGDDKVGQQSVAQVVLNRVRHPSFPNTVCGVVFQGSERATGCQFSFTCDGSISRRQPSAAAWTRARAVAVGALTGEVYAPVGYATHYHTDWVVPYWSSSLDKIAAVKTHLFFRWGGSWGTPRAFYQRPSATEPAVQMIASLSSAHKALPPGIPVLEAVDPLSAAPADAAPAAVSAGAADLNFTFSPTANNPDIFLVALPASVDRSRYPELAARACGSRPRCLFMGWNDASKMPTSLPASTSQLQGMGFHFIRDPSFATPRSRWNCALERRPDPQQCLSHQVPAAPSPVATTAATTVSTP